MEKAPAVCTGESAKRRLRSAQTAKGRLRFQGGWQCMPGQKFRSYRVDPEHVSSQEKPGLAPRSRGRTSLLNIIILIKNMPVHKHECQGKSGERNGLAGPSCRDRRWSRTRGCGGVSFLVWFIIGPRRGCGLGTLALPLSRVDQPESRGGNIQHLKTHDSI